MELVNQEEIVAITSVLTYEEIIFYSQKTKNLKTGLRVCTFLSKSPISVESLTLKITKRFLRLVKRYPNIRSADLVHAATCLSLGLKRIITVDEDFDKIKEIKRIDPKKFLS